MKKWAFLILLFKSVVSYAVAVNEPAPAFLLSNSHHEKRALSDYKGKVVVINFWASWCAPCQAELPELRRLATDYEGRKVQVFAINVDENRDTAKKMLDTLKSLPASMDVLFDPKSKVVSAYNIDSMPSSYILDAKGIIRYSHTGFHSGDPEKWRHEIDSLLNGR